MRSRADKLRAIINCPTVNPNEREAAKRALAKHARVAPERVTGRAPRPSRTHIVESDRESSEPAAEHGYEGRWEKDTRGREGRVLTFDVKRDDAPSYIRGTAVRVKAPDGKVYDCRVLAVRLCPRYQPSHVITEPVEQASRTTFWMGGPHRY